MLGAVLSLNLMFLLLKAFGGQIEYLDFFGGIWNLDVGSPVDAIYDDSHDLRHGKISGMTERSGEDLGTILVLLPCPGHNVFFIFLDVAGSELVPD